MTLNEGESYLTAPEYNDAMNSFQLGHWEAGLVQINELVEKFPLNTELRALRQEMLLRSKIDDYEKDDHQRESRQKAVKFLARLAVIVLFVIVLVWTASTYYSFIQQQWTDTVQRIDKEVQTLDLRVKFTNAQNLLAAGRVDEARTLFAEVEAKDPNYPGLANVLTDVEIVSEVDTRYDQAVAQLNQGNLDQALELFVEISLENPIYRDVALQIDNIQRDLYLRDLLFKADTAYQEERWVEAVESYTNVRAIDTEYKNSYVHEQLFRSLLNAAETAIQDPEGSAAELEQAESYFRMALALRPQDQEVLERRAKTRKEVEERLFWKYVNMAEAVLAENSESLDALTKAEEYFQAALNVKPGNDLIRKKRDLARLYVNAQRNFLMEQWAAVITDLEVVVGIDKAYALGTASQTLHEAYLARGDSLMANGTFELALSDYRKASVLAEDVPNAVMRIYEAQIRLANAMGAYGEYESAVQAFQAAIESADLLARLEQENKTAYNKLTSAEVYARGGNYRRAYTLYKEVFFGSSAEFKTTYKKTVLHTVVAGEYLTMIASRYSSTITAIVDANGIADPNLITAGKQLIIPIFD